MAVPTDRLYRCPGPIRELRGVIFQSDGRSTFGAWFIRPLEALDRRLAGVRRSPGAPSLAMHAAVHVVLEDGREMVAEQLIRSIDDGCRNALCWTPLEQFRQRDRGGWDVTIPATAFRGVDDRVVSETIERLSTICGRPFLIENCISFVERAFGGRRMFAESSLLRLLGLGVRFGDPALPLLRPDVRLDPRAEWLLRADKVRALPDPSSSWVGCRWAPRVLFAALGAALGLALGFFGPRCRDAPREAPSCRNV